MVFSSTIFLFAFLPLFLAVYFAMPWRPAKNVVLLLFSLLFYAWGEPVYVWLMVASICFNWLFAFIIGKCGEGKTAPKRFWLVAALAANLLVLGFYKYQGFLAENINRAIGEEFIAELNLALPIGISFFTLQAITYVVDVYRGEVKVQKNPLYLGMYIAMFPQLVAGPIVRYADIEHEIDNRRATLEGFAQGLRLFCVGLGKKVLLANTAGVLADSLLPREAAEIGFIGCFSGVAAYTFQIYFDFSGYSDMAIGLGKMMGFEYPRNFNYPYIAKSVTEFWRRWHISLGTWFREYLYIPLGGNRVSKPRLFFNLLVVWAATGIWHGASWNFVLWGVMLLGFILLEKFCIGNFLKEHKVLSHVYLLFVIPQTWVIFRITRLKDVGAYFSRLFPLFGAHSAISAQDVLKLLSSYWWLLLLAIFFCLPQPRRFYEKHRGSLLVQLPLFLLFWVCVYFIATSSGNAFLYSRF